jgi:hypothetical protein
MSVGYTFYRELVLNSNTLVEPIATDFEDEFGVRGVEDQNTSDDAPCITSENFLGAKITLSIMAQFSSRGSKFRHRKLVDIASVKPMIFA